MSRDVLDHGFVKLIDTLGNDLSIVNAARISFNKRKDEFDEKDAQLLRFLAINDHTAPFRHCQLTFHVKAPIFVLRQWMRYKIASDFNEISGRYVDLGDVEYYTPEVFRKQAKINKQGSEGQVDENNLVEIKELYEDAMYGNLELYRRLLDKGVCKEQARAVLPLGIYSEVYWTASLQSVCHFIKQRTDSHAQWEIQQYAEVVKTLMLQHFPIGGKELLNHTGVVSTHDELERFNPKV